MTPEVVVRIAGAVAAGALLGYGFLVWEMERRAKKLYKQIEERLPLLGHTGDLERIIESREDRIQGLQEANFLREGDIRSLQEELDSRDEKIRELEEAVQSWRKEARKLEEEVNIMKQSETDAIILKPNRKDGVHVSSITPIIGGHAYKWNDMGYAISEDDCLGWFGSYAGYWEFRPYAEEDCDYLSCRSQEAKRIRRLEEWALKYYRADKDDEVQGQEEKAAEQGGVV